MKRKTIKFYTTENAWDYVNFIDDYDLGSELDNFECGYKDGSFFIDIEGKESLIGCIKNLNTNYFKLNKNIRKLKK